MDYILSQLYKKKQYIKFVISGGTAASVDFSLLYLLHGILFWHVILSASIAFAAAFFVSFYLQKFWTFRDSDKKGMQKQMAIYFGVGITNLLVNAIGMHFLIKWFNVHYILAQLICSVLIAMGNFLMYKFVIFKNRRRERKLEKKFGHRTKQRFFVILNTENFKEFKPTEDCEYRGLIFCNEIDDPNLFNFDRVVRTKYKIINFVKIFFQVRKWIHWSDKVKCYSLDEASLPGYMVAKLSGKQFILQTKIEGRQKGWRKRIIKEMNDVVI